MLTTPTVARFHNPLASSSATATLKWARRRSFKLRTTCRLSLSDCAASILSSRVRKAIIERRRRSAVVGRWQNLAPEVPTTDDKRPMTISLRHRFSGDFFSGEGFNHVADFDVSVVGDGDAAFHAVGDLAGIVLEAAKRPDFAFEDDHVVAQQSDFGVAFDQPIDDRAAGHGANFWNAEGLANFGASLIGFFDGRFEQAGHGALDLILQFVNDRVQPDVDLFLIGQFLRLAFGAHVEPDDDGIRSRGQQHIGFRYGAHSGMQNFQANLVVRKFRKQIAEDFDRTAHVGLQNDVEFLSAGGLELLRQTFERYTRTLGQCGFTGLLFTVFGNAARLVAIGDHYELISGLRQAFHSENFDRG